MAQLVKHFGWMWVGSIAIEDDYGQYLVQLFNEQVQNDGICLGFTETIPKVYSHEKILQIVETIKKSTVKIIVLFAGVGDIINFVNEVVRQNITNRQWIASETWSTAALLATKENFKSFGGTLGFAFRNEKIPQFKEFLLKVHPSSTPGNALINRFWENLFSCTLNSPDDITSTISSKPMCTRQEDIGKIDSVYSDVSQLRVSYNVYKAVYAIAHALHNLVTCESNKGPFMHKTCANVSHFEPWQVRYFYIMHCQIVLVNNDICIIYC